MTDICIEFGEIFAESSYGPVWENILQDYLKNTTFVERDSMNERQRPQFSSTISSDYDDWDLLSSDEIQKRLKDHCHVTNSTCDTDGFTFEML